MSSSDQQQQEKKSSIAEDHVATICRFRPARSPSTVWSRDQYSADLEKYSAVLGPTATNKDLFDQVGRPLVDEMLEGKNVTVLCYGQTGSGKTHSIFRGKDLQGNEDLGLLPRSVQYLFDKCNANKRAMRFRVSISIVEVYKEEVRDLMTSSSSNSSSSSLTPLQMREKNEIFFLPDVNVKVCSTADTLLREVNSAFTNRTTGNSYLSDVSSRAHAVATISIAAETNVRGSSPVLLLSRMSFVDLCGTEVLSDKFGADQQSETKSINKSLFSLRGVVSALAEKASFIPYRDSVLTKLLKATLSRDSMNAIICTCSPDPQDEPLTLGAIGFGQTAQRIEQSITKRIFTREKGAGGKIKMKDEADETTIKLEDFDGKKKKDDQQQDQEQPKIPIVSTKVTISTRQGDISTQFFAKDGILPEQAIASGKVAIALHAFGGGCCGEDMKEFCVPAIENGTVDGCFSPDMPGFGNTQGARQTSRTDSLWNQGGPMEVVVDLLDHVTEKKKSRQVLFICWDWGANMGLSLAVSSFKNRMSALVLFHPSWTSPHEQLAPVKLPVLMLWNPNDTLHLIAHGRKMAKIMAKSKLVAVKPKAGMRGRESYDEIFHIMAAQIDTFTKGLPSSSAKSATTKSAAAAVKPKVQEEVTPITPAPPPKTMPSSSSSDDEDEDDDENINDDEFEQDELASLDDLSDFSRESSFLSLLLIDTEVVDAAVANERSRALKKKDKHLRKEVDADTTSTELFTKLSSLKLVASNNATASSSPQRDRIRDIVKTIATICNTNTKTRLAFAYALLGRNNPLKSSIIGALGLLPPLLPYSTGPTFRSLGFLDVLPRGAHSPSWAKSRLCRYLPGRTVMVGVPGEVVCQDMRQPETLGCLMKNIDAASLQARVDRMTAATRFYSFRCRVVGVVSPQLFRVEIETEELNNTWIPFNVSLSQLEKMNAPTNFPLGPSKLSLVFEDAIRGRYDNLIMRSKLAQCCEAIAPYLSEMDFDAAWNERSSSSSSTSTLEPNHNTKLLNLQIKCVKALRNCVDIHHHVARGKDPNRALVPDIGSLATFGQFHCHGLASTFAGILLPFCAILGLDVRQRDGFFAKDLSSAWDGTPLRSADHTWCEITFHPSGVNFVTDPSFSPKFGDDVVAKYRDIYSVSGRRYPTRDLTSAADSRVLMDSKQCFLLHDESGGADEKVKMINSMRKLVWNDVSEKLSFM